MPYGWTTKIIIEDKTMGEMKRKKVQRQPIHPGAVLREDVLPDLGITVSSLAKGVHVSRQSIHRIRTEEKGITPAMALRIGKFIGNGPDVWLRMQQTYDLYMTEREMALPDKGNRECTG